MTMMMMMLMMMMIHDDDDDGDDDDDDNVKKTSSFLKPRWYIFTCDISKIIVSLQWRAHFLSI